MVSFEEKKVIFKSFKLKEKEISNGRVNFIYPESKQKGQVLARELQPSGNGYVIGKYMPNEVLEKNGYQVDARGWISIKDFPKDELAKLITEAMKSMSGQEVKMVQVDEAVIVEEQVEHAEEVVEETQEDTGIENDQVEASLITTEVEAPVEKEAVKIQKPDTQHAAHKEKPVDPYLEYEQYPLSCWFAWVGLALSSMETGFLIWRNAIRKYGELRQK
ncbi:hypothetical protein [Bacillus sp. FJAT-29814]|uniref:hypothetical protein n=1 Tax=Bacillus sp. FJAT-29814 TaxID=1729688 RepID=UPI000836502D|nr:hypothetical protein [Bacillus sp. FJAT-29814]